MLIIDFGSGNSCRNSLEEAQRMIDALANVDRQRKCIIKWQLFEKCGDNIPLQRSVFARAYTYAWEIYGYETTASVFDKPSLDFLMRFDIPFVKIANNEKYYPLIDMIREGMPIIKSVGSPEGFKDDCTFLCCVSEYPAIIKQYEKVFKKGQLKKGISDHTSDWELYLKYKPETYECHFCLENQDGPDSGTFARRPKQLMEIL